MLCMLGKVQVLFTPQLIDLLTYARVQGARGRFAALTNRYATTPYVNRITYLEPNPPRVS